MLKRRTLAASLLTATLVTLTAAPAVQAVNSPKYNYVGWSGGTIIRAVGSTISSDLTAQSYVAGIQVPRSASNNVAVIEVGDVARTGAVETFEHVDAFEDGVKLTSFARTANVNLLNGLITADAVETINVTTASPTNGMNTTAHTTFVNLDIGDLNLPVNIGKNYKVKIPGVATIVANGQEITEQDGILTSFSYGLKVVLLDALAGIGAKSVIFLNPTFAGLAPAVPVDTPRLAGHAFGTQVHSSATSEIRIDSGRTANVNTPPGGTNDQVVTNTTLTAKVPKVLTAGTVLSTTRGLTFPDFGEVTNTNDIVGINVLNGLITADVIKTRAHATRADNVFSCDLKMNLVNLVVAGNQIPIDAGPNTTIKIGDLATVIINKQDKNFQACGVTGIYVKLLKPQGEFPTGAIVRVSQALAWIPPVQG